MESAAFWHSGVESALGKQEAVTEPGALYHFGVVESECSVKRKVKKFNWL